MQESATARTTGGSVVTHQPRPHALPSYTLPEDDLPVLYQVVALHNGGPGTQRLRIFGCARLRGTLQADVQARYDPALGALVAHNASQPQAVRIFGLTAPPSGFATSVDFGRIYD